MRLVANKAVIKSKRAFKRIIFSRLNKRKEPLSKDLLTKYLGRVRMLKQRFCFSKKKRFSAQRNVARKFFVLKQLLKISCLNSYFNLIVVIRSQQEYLRMKNELFFSHLGLLDFKFWHLKKSWIYNLFKANPECLSNFSVLNGSVLVLRTANLNALFETFALFEHRNAFCVGLYMYNRLIWPSYFLKNVANLPDNFFNLQGSVYIFLSGLLKKLATFVFVLDCFFKKLRVSFTGKNA